MLMSWLQLRGTPKRTKLETANTEQGCYGAGPVLRGQYRGRRDVRDDLASVLECMGTNDRVLAGDVHLDNKVGRSSRVFRFKGEVCYEERKRVHVD